ASRHPPVHARLARIAAAGRRQAATAPGLAARSRVADRRGAMMPIIDVADLRVSFGAGRNRVHAVDGIAFRVERGETFGLIGESGCGKSTTLRALCGLTADWEGRATIDGTPVPRRRDRAFCKRVQMVFQDPYGSLHPRHTVDTALAEPIRIHRLGDSEARIRRALD